jgi:predicted metal-dependent phosphoesterase TrpH
MIGAPQEGMGIKLKWERVLEIAGEAAPGRPHVAEALVESGHVATFREAFARYLHNDGPAYVEVRLESRLNVAFFSRI